MRLPSLPYECLMLYAYSLSNLKRKNIMKILKLYWLMSKDLKLKTVTEWFGHKTICPSNLDHWTSSNKQKFKKMALFSKIWSGLYSILEKIIKIKTRSWSYCLSLSRSMILLSRLYGKKFSKIIESLAHFLSHSGARPAFISKVIKCFNTIQIFYRTLSADNEPFECSVRHNFKFSSSDNPIPFKYNIYCNLP